MVMNLKVNKAQDLTVLVEQAPLYPPGGNLQTRKTKKIQSLRFRTPEEIILIP